MSSRVDAVLLLDKRAGLSSNAALQEAKRLYGARKAGHSGTLDPLASGLLPIAFGEATKFAQFALGADKEYLAQVRLGVATTTGDAEGEIVQRNPVRLEEASIGRALAHFRGEIEQVPPMYAALKHAGRPLYALAREGRTVERAPRRIVIRELELLSRCGDVIELRVRCSKGTYVRQLAHDLGVALGIGAHLAGLRRTAVGGLRVEQAIGLQELRSLDVSGRLERLLPAESLVSSLARLELPAALARRFLQGQSLQLDDARRGPCRVYLERGALLGVGELRGAGQLRAVRLLARSPSKAANG
jgi:tRNA pseudouridine55 synthase